MNRRAKPARETPVRLLLVRHAPAHERGPGWPRDASRPLTPRGVDRARRASLGLKLILPHPTAVLASPLVRTMQTAAILHRHARWPQPVACPLLAPGCDPGELLALLRQQPPHEVAGTVVLVGHEPDLSALLAHCLAGAPTDATFGLKKMGAALLHFPQRIGAGGAVLVWLATPKILRSTH